MITRRDLPRSMSLLAVAAAVLPAFIRTAVAANAKPAVVLFKNPGCECCDGYAAYLGQHGFTVTVRETPNYPSSAPEPAFQPSSKGVTRLSSVAMSWTVMSRWRRSANCWPNNRPSKVSPSGMPPGSPGMDGPKRTPFVVYGIDRKGKSTPYVTI